MQLTPRLFNETPDLVFHSLVTDVVKAQLSVEQVGAYSETLPRAAGIYVGDEPFKWLYALLIRVKAN